MPQLTNEHINFIIKDLSYRGVVQDDVREEMLDHICCVVETEMNSGKRFYDAYQFALKSFGNTRGIHQLQRQIIHTKTKAKGMLKNYLVIALRNHLKHKFYTAINVAGLAIGIASCLVILLFVLHEISYDRFHEKADRIYRVNTEIKVGAVHHNLALGSSALGELFKQNYPEIESYVRLWSWDSRLVKRVGSDQAFRENVVWGDSTFFQVFTVPLLEGNAATALAQPNSIAISKKMAQKYFRGDNVLGQSLILDDDKLYRITAVYEDLPVNSHFHFDIIRSMVGLEEAKSVSLIGGSELNLYLLLREANDARDLEKKFPAFIGVHIAPQLAAAMQNDFSMEKFEREGNIWKYTLTPLTDIHLYSDMNGEFEANGSIGYVYLFSFIAIFILLIACINFMNLSTARSVDRAKEIGIRKVMGSLRRHLVRQFLTESLLLTVVAFGLSLVLAHLFLPLFNTLALKNLSLPWDSYTFYLAIIAAALVVGIMAGLYPSFFLSGFKPVAVLKGKLSLGTQSGFIRSGLVVFQFVISIFLMIGTITVERQLSYIQNKKVGFSKEQVLVVHQAQFLDKQTQAFKDEVLRNNFIIDGTISGYLPVAGTWRSFNTFWPEGKAPTGEDVKDMVSMQEWRVDVDYISTLGMNLKSGRNFSADIPSDSKEAIILNEAAVEKFNLGQNPLGKRISSFGGTNPDGTPDFTKIEMWTVIGVVENFHFESMRETIAPVGLFLGNANGYISFRYESSNTEAALNAIQATWKKMVPNQAFEYSFLDEDFGKMYNSEKRLGTIFGIFAILAIVIACLGLFALTAFSARQRTKEIGIRKTLGASVESIVLLLSKSYGKLVLIAFALSAPIAWYAVDFWLEGYTYKATIGATVYVLAGASAFIIAMLTISYQAINAARANPAKSIRSE
jgi:putative ABC transport system permease protein